MVELHLDSVKVLHRLVEGRFEACVNGESAFVSYRRMGNSLVMEHTFVPAHLEGHGIAGKLVGSALEYARAAGLQVLPSCPYVADYLLKHPEYQDLLSPLTRSRLLGK